MTIKIGKVIKKLRTERNITQDMLANALAITPQAVSRWESGITYPDLEFLPVLADYFSITTDELLGYKLSEREEELAAAKKEAERLAEVGSADERIAHTRKALVSYPFDTDLKTHLAAALYHKWCDNNEADIASEAEALCMSIIKECKDEENTYSAVFTLCSLYGAMNKPEKAKALIDENLTPMKYRKEFMLSGGIGDGKTEIYIQDEIDKLTDGLGTAMQNLVLNEDIPNDPTTWDKKIEILNTANKLYLMIYGENLMFYHCRLVWNYWLISTYQLAQGKEADALYSLEEMLRHTLAYVDAWQNSHGKHYSSVLTDKLVYPCPGKDFHEFTEHNVAFYMLDRLQHKRYDTIRENARFEAIVSALKEAAE